MSARNRRGRTGFAPGFTLIELGFVIAIISIIYLVASADFRRLFRKIEFQSAGYRLLTSLSFARAESIANAVEYRIAFASNLDSYSVYGKNQKEIFSRQFPDSVEIKEISPMEVVFRPDGTSTSFEFKAAGDDGGEMLIRVFPFTGRAKLIEK